LGHLGTPAAVSRLELMVDDPDAGTRYNAAVALAHRGNEKAMETLLEMLDLDEAAGVREEADAGKSFKRTVIVVSAINAVRALSEKNPQADISPAIAALEKIVQADSQTLEKAYVSRQVVADARQALAELKDRK
jgi:HEAT repeat protein